MSALIPAVSVLAGSLLGGGKKASLPSLPPFQADPLVGNAENSMFNFGSDVLKGILPNSYQNLLQFDSPQFESVLHNSNRDIQNAALEQAARTGNINSGASQANITKATSDNTANMRYTDYLNTLTNQKSLLSLGLGAENSGGQLALGNQGQINDYTLGGYRALLGVTPDMTKLSMAGQASTGQAIGSAFGSVASSLPYLFNNLSPIPGVSTDGGINPGTVTGSLGSDNSTPGGINIDDIIKQLSEKGGYSLNLQ